MKSRILSLCLILVMASLLFGLRTTHASASAYPDKTVTFIVPSGPGGGLDTMCRKLASVLPKYLPGKGNIIIKNITPPAIIKGTTVLNRSKPDGYTIGMTYVESCVWAQYTQHLSFDVRKLTHLGSLHSNKYYLVAKADYPYNSLKEIAASKTRVVWAELPTAYQLWALIACHSAGIKDYTIITSLKGAKGMVLALLRGDADLAIISTASVQPYLKSGDLKALMSLTKTPMAKGIPTAKQLGYEVLAKALNPQIFVGPPNMDKAIANVLSEAAYKAVTTDKAFIDWGRNAGYDMKWMSPKGIAKDTDRTSRLFKKYIPLLKNSR